MVVRWVLDLLHNTHVDLVDDVVDHGVVSLAPLHLGHQVAHVHGHVPVLPVPPELQQGVFLLFFLVLLDYVLGHFLEFLDLLLDRVEVVEQVVVALAIVGYDRGILENVRMIMVLGGFVFERESGLGPFLE